VALFVGNTYKNSYITLLFNCFPSLSLSIVDNQDTPGIGRVTDLPATTDTSVLTQLILQQLMKQRWLGGIYTHQTLLFSEKGMTEKSSVFNDINRR
jgi:hypothetical protein